MLQEPAHACAHVAGLLLTAHLAAAETSCPAEYYRTDVIVWECSGAFGSAYYYMEPQKLGVAIEIPKGVQGFAVNITAETDMDVLIVDGAEGEDFSGYGHSRENGEELLKIPGDVPEPLDLKLRNYAEEADTAIMTYRYEGIDSCPKVPLGCKRYNVTKSKGEVQRWSCWTQAQYNDADAAWTALGEPQVLSFTNTIPWHRFEPVWAKWIWNGGFTSWQYAFHFLDTNDDQQVSREEFDAGYELCPATTTPMATTTTAVAATSTSDAASLLTASSSASLQQRATNTSLATVDGIADTPAADDTGRNGTVDFLGIFSSFTQDLAASDWRKWPPDPLIAGAAAAAAFFLLLLACALRLCCRPQPEPTYRSLPSLEDDALEEEEEELSHSPRPERAPRIDEPPAHEEEPAWSYTVKPRVRTFMTAVPRIVLKPIASPPLPLTGLVRPLPPPAAGMPLTAEAGSFTLGSLQLRPPQLRVAALPELRPPPPPPWGAGLLPSVPLAPVPLRPV